MQLLNTAKKRKVNPPRAYKARATTELWDAVSSMTIRKLRSNQKQCVIIERKRENDAILVQIFDRHSDDAKTSFSLSLFILNF